MNKVKNMFMLVIFSMICIGLYNICIINVDAESNESNYASLCEEITYSNILDQETIEKYSDYIEIIDGRYVFTCDSSDEDTSLIMNNIEIVNSFINNDEGYLTEDGLVFYCEDELTTQFGFSSVKWHWYGVDMTMNDEMIIAVCVATIAVNFISGRQLTNAIKNKSFTSVIDAITSYIMSKIGSVSNMISLMGSRGYARLIDKYGSYNTISTVINTTLSTILYAGLGVLTVACFASGGAAAVVWSIISYVIGTFTPGLISTTVLFVSSICGIVNTAKMKIRWLRGWGTNLYY